MDTRRTRYKQFSLLFLSILLGLGGWLTWFVWDTQYKWWVQLIAGVLGIVVALVLIYAAWAWLLKWEVKWS